MNHRTFAKAAPRAAFVLALLASVSPAQSILGPGEPVKEHTLVRLAVDDPAGASWVVLPAGPADLAEIDGGRQLVFSAPPGAYTVLAAVVVDGRPKILSREVVVGAASAPKPAGPPEPSRPEEVDDPPNRATDALGRAARAYATSVPTALRDAAEAIRSGRITTVNEAVDQVARSRDGARGAYGQALDEATRGAVDQAGTIVDPARYAAALSRAAEAMYGEGVRP